MNTKELDFAYKVRHALNENIDNLPASTTARLESARRMAVKRKKKHSPLRVLVPTALFAGDIGNFVQRPLAWMARAGFAVPLIVLAVGLTSIYQYEEQRRVNDIAEMDAAVLADELPLSAYLDDGFKAYLTKPDD